MKRHRVFALILTLIITASLIFGGCGKIAETQEFNVPAENTAAGDKLDANQTIYVRGYDYKSLDPSAESDAATFTCFNQVFEGLGREIFENGADRVILAGAEKMDVSKDGLVYTFTIRNGSKWSDGKDVTAHDYEFSWKRLINPDNAYDYMHFLDFVKGVPEYIEKKGKIEDVGIKALDDRTFQVTLSSPVPYFDKMLSFGCLVPQREDIFNRLGKDYGQAWDKIVYNGPFKIDEYAKGSKIVYVKNEQYWDAQNVKLTRVEAPIVEEQATMVQLFQAKQFENFKDAAGDYIEQLKSQKDAGGYDYITGTTASVFYLIFNFKNPVLSNAKVRKAITVAFDKQAFLDTVYKRFIPAYGIVPDQLMTGDKVYRREVPEPEKKLFDEIKDPKALFIEGLKEMNMDPDPAKVKLLLLMPPASSTRSAAAQFTQNQIETALGCNVEIQFAVDTPAYFQSRTNGEFDLCHGGWGADFNDISSYFQIFTSEDGNNNGKYNNKEYDNLVNAAIPELDNEKRLDMFRQAEEILLYKDPAVVSTYYDDVQTFRYKYVKGLIQPLFGGYYILRDAYIQGRN